MKHSRGFALPEIMLIIITLVALSLISYGLYYQLYRRPPQTSHAPTLFEIINSGSTNYAGWSLLVRTDGSGVLACSTGLRVACKGNTYKSGAFPADSLSSSLVATNLASYKGNCVRSASFGSTDTLIYQGYHMDDVDCYAQNDTTPLANELSVVLHKINVSY